MKVFTSKGKRDIVCPNCWGPEFFKPTEYIKAPIPTSTDLYQRIIKDWDGKDLVRIFSILTGMEYKALSTTHDLALEESLIEATRYIYESPMDWKEAKVPESITINSREVKIPKRIEGFSMGQSILVRQKLDTVKTYDECISYAIAVYIQPYLDESDFDAERALELEADIKLMPITQTFALGFFLLRPLMRRGLSGWRIASLLITRCFGPFRLRGRILPLLLALIV